MLRLNYCLKVFDKGNIVIAICHFSHTEEEIWQVVTAQLTTFKNAYRHVLGRN